MSNMRSVRQLHQPDLCYPAEARGGEGDGNCQ
jgi:hypothetical protein